MAAVIILLAISLILLLPYTRSFQKTTYMLGRELSHSPDTFSYQDAITGKMQTVRSVSIFGLMIALFATTTYAYAWYHALWVFILTMVVSAIFDTAWGYKAGHPRLISSIRKNLESRRRGYEVSKDQERGMAINTLLERLKELYDMNGVKRN